MMCDGFAQGAVKLQADHVPRVLAAHELSAIRCQRHAEGRFVEEPNDVCGERGGRGGLIVSRSRPAPSGRCRCRARVSAGAGWC